MSLSVDAVSLWKALASDRLASWLCERWQVIYPLCAFVSSSKGAPDSKRLFSLAEEGEIARVLVHREKGQGRGLRRNQTYRHLSFLSIFKKCIYSLEMGKRW